MSFRFKLFFTFILFGIFLSFFAVYSFSQVIREIELQKEQESTHALLINKENKISSFINEADANIYAIADSKIFKKYLISKNHKEKKYIIELFKAIGTSDDSISQIRYIDNNGQEKIRVETITSQAIVIGKNKLQDKSDRYYFKEIKKKTMHQVWHSKFDLNIENGKIQHPLNPMFRVGLNVGDGILIINVSLENIMQYVKHNLYNLLLVDKDGEVLIDSSDEYSWSSYLKKEFDLAHFLEIGGLSFLKYDTYHNEKFCSMKVKANNLDNAVLIVVYQENLLDLIREKMFFSYVTLFVSILFLAIILAFLFAKPISKLTEDIEKLNDELDNKVEERTSALNDSLKIIDKYIIRSTTDLNGTIINVSDAFCKVSKYTREELIGKPHSLVRDPDTPKEVFTELWDTITSGKCWEGELKNRAKDGTPYWIKAYIEPNFDKNGKIISYTAIRKNITDKVLLETQIDENKAIIRFASSGIGTMDLQGNFLSVNSYYTQLFGYTQKELLGKNCIDMTVEGYKDIAKEALDIANEIGVITQVEKVCLDKMGNEVAIEMSLNLLPDEKSFVVVVNSLEDKKKLKALNKSLKIRIEQEVEKNTKQLEMRQKEQIESVKLSSIGALAAGITHEINTPLTYIKGNFELMGYDIDDLEDGALKERMKNDSVKIVEGIDRIANIIESMKEVSQTSSEKKEIVNIYSTIITALTVSHNAIKQSANVYLNDQLFDINIDKNRFILNAKVQKQRLEQVWIVIIKNALDQLVYIDDYENRKLTINISQKAEYIIVKFKDNAGGIDKAILEHIFEPFVSLKEHGGIGVGLNIAKKIVEDQDGKIVAYNEDNGAVFEVTLKIY